MRLLLLLFFSCISVPCLCVFSDNFFSNKTQKQLEKERSSHAICFILFLGVKSMLQLSHILILVSLFLVLFDCLSIARVVLRDLTALSLSEQSNTSKRRTQKRYLLFNLPDTRETRQRTSYICVFLPRPRPRFQFIKF
jgi:hypothetical protein